MRVFLVFVNYQQCPIAIGLARREITSTCIRIVLDISLVAANILCSSDPGFSQSRLIELAGKGLREGLRDVTVPGATLKNPKLGLVELLHPGGTHGNVVEVMKAWPPADRRTEQRSRKARVLQKCLPSLRSADEYWTP